MTNFEKGYYVVGVEFESLIDEFRYYIGDLMLYQKIKITLPYIFLGHAHRYLGTKSKP